MQKQKSRTEPLERAADMVAKTAGAVIGVGATLGVMGAATHMIP